MLSYSICSNDILSKLVLTTLLTISFMLLFVQYMLAYMEVGIKIKRDENT